MAGCERTYVFHESTLSLCHKCLNRLQAKIIIKDDGVFLLKYCPEHGEILELYEEDVEYFLKKKSYDKPGTCTKTQTKIEKGCPFDCGICPSHDQHACIGVIEITNKCNMACNTCFANASAGEHLELSKIEKMMDFFQDSENNCAEILQISGGEPTIHPEILKIIEMAREKKFKYVMLNTNGLRISEDESFVKSLSEFKGGFEVYLQFDGLDDNIYEKMRGQKLLDKKLKAVENLAKYKIPTTLVATVQKDLNDKELGRIIEFGLNTKYVRGINFQPLALFGRVNEEFRTKRITLSGILKNIEIQTKNMIMKNDFIPLPCNVERVAITYLFRKGSGFIPITRNSRIKDYLPLINNTFVFTLEETIIKTGKALFEIEKWGCCLDFIKDFKSFFPVNFFTKNKEERIQFVDENTFRISVSSFVDVHNFDLKSVQKDCVHIITQD